MKGTEMTVREFLAMEIDVDVVDDAGHEKRIQSKFFKEFYNQLLTKDGFPDNITFSGHPDAKYPMLMWEDDEAVAEFCPIIIK